jgi:hypothetical protein
MSSKELWTLFGFGLFAFIGIVSVVYKVWKLDYDDQHPQPDDDSHGATAATDPPPKYCERFRAPSQRGRPSHVVKRRRP